MDGPGRVGSTSVCLGSDSEGLGYSSKDPGTSDVEEGWSADSLGGPQGQTT